jgi:hypothetical protein
MNRTLRRPMFRIGGSVAEGITSGLDQPQLNASRVNFKRGRVVEPGGYQGDEDLKKDYQRAWKLLQDVRPKRDPYFPQFLAGMGLDLVSRPTSGNLMADIATSAKGPFDQWMQSKTGLADVDDKLAAALFGDVMDIKAKRDLQEAKIKGEKEVAQIETAGGKKQFEYKGKLTDYSGLIDEGHRLVRKLEEAQAISPEEMSPALKEEKIRGIKEEISKNIDLQAMFKGDEEDKIRKALLDQIGSGLGPATWADLVEYDQTKKIPSRLLKEGMAEGGRVGYQGGGMSLPSAAPAAVPAAGTMDQGAEQDSPVQDLSFEELRARLPQEITNDIVQLIANSKQALVDFANIRTQQDVNAFNQKYDVNLVVPQEA